MKIKIVIILTRADVEYFITTSSIRNLEVQYKVSLNTDSQRLITQGTESL